MFLPYKGLDKKVIFHNKLGPSLNQLSAQWGSALKICFEHEDKHC